MIDLLPDRLARGFAAWLGGQGDVEIISRDRWVSTRTAGGGALPPRGRSRTGIIW